MSEPKSNIDWAHMVNEKQKVIDEQAKLIRELSGPKFFKMELQLARVTKESELRKYTLGRVRTYLECEKLEYGDSVDLVEMLEQIRECEEKIKIGEV